MRHWPGEFAPLPVADFACAGSSLRLTADFDAPDSGNTYAEDLGHVPELSHGRTSTPSISEVLMTNSKDAPPDPAPELWDANDAARYLKVSRSWVYQRAEAGLLPVPARRWPDPLRPTRPSGRSPGARCQPAKVLPFSDFTVGKERLTARGDRAMLIARVGPEGHDRTPRRGARSRGVGLSETRHLVPAGARRGAAGGSARRRRPRRRPRRQAARGWTWSAGSSGSGSGSSRRSSRTAAARSTS